MPRLILYLSTKSTLVIKGAISRWSRNITHDPVSVHASTGKQSRPVYSYTNNEDATDQPNGCLSKIRTLTPCYRQREYKCSRVRN
ncbi:hypothetical protein L210DRAFT_940960 [Boletus edulis BED1]|uniref:Uncharacterized protein n=1 Tax=Boletus edulis BED1 TaxID=1328754 RepID=A0AAD4GFE8_BOLED|nr:hypothetical protein L210DRAFT_940960 [Boletus edulis BED1]